jgi:hypothetical protein
MLKRKCEECGRIFDLANRLHGYEWEFGHDCEPDEKPYQPWSLLNSMFGQ